MINELNRLKYKIESLQKHKQANDQTIQSLVNQENDLNQMLAQIIEERQYYKRAVDVVYERSVQELKDILNSALYTIFGEDANYTIDIVLTDKRGKSLQFKAYKDGKPVNLKRGTGMGVKTVISAILHMYYLQCKNSKILMLDEAYSAVSEEYVPAFFEFLHQMCEQLQFKIILITHDKRFLQYADKTYRITAGEVTSG